HVLLALLAALAAGLPLRGIISRPRARISLILIASLATLFLAARMTRIAWKITVVNRDDPSFVQLARFVDANLPPNAVLLLEPREKGEHIIAMFQIDRSIYPVAPTTEQTVANEVRAAGGVPFLLTNRAVPLPPVSADFLDGLHGYSLGDSDLQHRQP